MGRSYKDIKYDLWYNLEKLGILPGDIALAVLAHPGKKVFSYGKTPHVGDINGVSFNRERYSFDGSNYVKVPNVIPSLPCSIITKAQVNSTSSFQRLYHSSINSGNPNLYGVYLQTTSGAELEVSFCDGDVAGNTARRSKIGGTVTTKTSVFGSVIRSATDMSLYINGIDVGGSYSGSGAEYAAGPGDGGIGVLEYSGTLYYLNGYVNHSIVCTSDLTASQMRRIAIDDIWQPRPNTSYFDVADTGSTILPTFFHHYNKNIGT